MERHLYLCCYDIHHERIRRKVRKEILKYSGLWQYSAYECFLTTAEKHSLSDALTELLEEGDTYRIQRITQFNEAITLGSAQQTNYESYVIWN